MIALTRLNGQPVVVNSDLIETVESNGDTVVTLTTGSVLVVRNSMEEIQRKVLAFRRGIRRPPDGEAP